MLMAERGAAAKTIEAYPRDLGEFLAFAASKQRDARMRAPTPSAHFLAALSRKGLAATSRARKLSAMRQFFRFLLGRGLRGDDPSVAIDSPKLGRPLPKTARLRRGRTAHRDSGARRERGRRRLGQAPGAPRLCLLEMLYATGMRVSELVSAAARRARRRRARADHQRQGRPRAAGAAQRRGARPRSTAHFGACRGRAGGKRATTWLFPSSGARAISRGSASPRT